MKENLTWEKVFKKYESMKENIEKHELDSESARIIFSLYQ